MSLDKLLAELQIEYLAALPTKIADIETHLRSGEMAKLRDDFHKLKGSGLTYGIPEISELCEVTELLCDSKPQAAGTFTPLTVSLLKGILQQRQAGQAYDLQKAAEFAKLQALA